LGGKSGLSCLAAESGGQYYPITNRTQLSDALNLITEKVGP
jgi:hypothetical protein